MTFSADNQPAQEKIQTGRALARSIKASMLDAYDHLGGTAWLVGFVRKNDENARVFVQKLLGSIPQEINSKHDGFLTVKIVTQLGDTEIDITPQKRVPQGATAVAPSSLGQALARVPAELPGV